jgi:AcrR family transcriptional regulator
MYHMVHNCTMWYMTQQAGQRMEKPGLLERCLRAFVETGTLDLSLDQLAARVGISKRMLVHYFGGRETIERKAMTLLEDRLRAQFSPAAFAPGATPKKVVTALWERTTAPESKGVLLLVMDLSRRAWNGSAPARAFYDEQQRLWVELLLKFIPDRRTVEELLQLFQGAVLAYLITGNPEPGRRALMRMLSRQSEKPKRRSQRS